MSKALTRRGRSGAVPAVASLIIPGAGQILNREPDKAFVIFALWLGAALALLGAFPLSGGVAALVFIGTHVCAIGDAYVTGRRR